jgi:hypothetical protein
VVEKKDDISKTYEVAQINHYWALSFKHFLRKIHRGAGSERKKSAESPETGFRSTMQFWSHIGGPVDFTEDTSFPTLYEPLFDELKGICMECFS